MDYSVLVPESPPAAPPGSCPNRKWTAAVDDVAFTSATVTVKVAGTDRILLTETFAL